MSPGLLLREPKVRWHADLMWEKKQRKLGREKHWVLREGKGSCTL